MRNLSKSKLISFRQCPKRLWLEIHHPELHQDSAATQASFSVGNLVGEIAQQIYDPRKIGVTLDAQRDGYAATFQRSMECLATAQPIFEAGYTAHHAFAFADVMLPEDSDGRRVWRMVEVKSSTRVKDYHRDDAAIQATLARHAGVPLSAIALAHIDSDFVYQGGGDYRGLLKEYDLTEEAFSREQEVVAWIDAAQQTAAQNDEPIRTTGKHCRSPFECGFLSHCQAHEPQAETPVSYLPGIAAKSLKQYIAAHPALELRDTPDNLLNKLQQRVKVHTLLGEVYFDAAGAADALKSYPLPAYFLDFETIQFAVPIWAGTSPYQQIPFQFSLHTLDENGVLAAQAFLDLSGGNPSRDFAEKLIAVCGNAGPIFVYNAGFEGARIKELAARFADLAVDLRAIKARLLDLHPVTQAHYYHPSQCGSWSIKAVLPAVAPDLSYQNLAGVKDGGMAMEAYLEAIHPNTTAARKAEIETQLLAYCGLDTFAMVRLWQFLAGRNEFNFEVGHG